jgi:hypothetical protein
MRSIEALGKSLSFSNTMANEGVISLPFKNGIASERITFFGMLLRVKYDETKSEVYGGVFANFTLFTRLTALSKETLSFFCGSAEMIAAVQVGAFL